MEDFEYHAIIDNSDKIVLTESTIRDATILYDSNGLPKQIIFENQRFNIVVEDANQDNYRVKVEGISFEIELKRPIHTLVEDLGFTKPKTQSDQVICSPMPGHILNLNKTEGEKVTLGENLLTLEAMKMENTIQSPRDGVVKHIYIKIGETVTKGQKLLEIG